jgi:hypothetical protein
VQADLAGLGGLDEVRISVARRIDDHDLVDADVAEGCGGAGQKFIAHGVETFQK